MKFEEKELSQGTSLAVGKILVTGQILDDNEKVATKSIQATLQGSHIEQLQKEIVELRQYVAGLELANRELMMNLPSSDYSDDDDEAFSLFADGGRDAWR